MFGPSRVMISAPAMSRLRMDSAMTASGMDLYQSCGVNCEVTIFDRLPSLSERMLKSKCAVVVSTGVVRKSSRADASTLINSL